MNTKRVIVALDSDNLKNTLKIAKKIKSEVYAFKIGYEFFFNFDEQDQKHKEELFRLKLRLFETEAGQSASRSQKAKIRKAETPIEIIHHYYDIVKPKKRTRSKQPVHSVKEG